MKRTARYRMDMLAALLLFCVFAACVLIVLLTGAGAYRRLTARDQLACDRRTCTQYIATRVRQTARPETAAVRDFCGTSALVLPDEYGYATWIYWHDGYVMELYAAADGSFAPEDGERLVPVEGLDMSLEDGLLKIQVDGWDCLCLSLRGMEGSAL